MGWETTIVDDVDGARRIAEDWDRLAVAARRPYATPAWMLAWWERMRPRDARLRVVAVRDGDRLVGLAPLHALGGDYAMLAGGFAGNAEPLAEAGAEQAVAAAVAAALSAAEARPRTLRLDQHGAEPGWPSLLSAAWPGGTATTCQVGEPEACPFVTIAGRDFDGWLAEKSSSFRREVRRKRKRLGEAGGTLRPATAATLEADVAELLRLHRARLDPRGGTLLDDERVAGMLVAVGRELLPGGRFRLVTMEVGGAAVGSQLMLAAGGEVCAWNSGFDERHAEQSPVMQCILHLLEDAMERGERRLSLGPGGQAYKYRLADGDEALTTTVVLPPGRGHLRARAEVALRARLRAARARLRQRSSTVPS